MNPQDLVAIRIVVVIILALLLRNWWVMEKNWALEKKKQAYLRTVKEQAQKRAANAHDKGE